MIFGVAMKNRAGVGGSKHDTKHAHDEATAYDPPFPILDLLSRVFAGYSVSQASTALCELEPSLRNQKLWSRPDALETVDVLFVDEAAQISLADALAVSQAAKTVVLLGDPQQLGSPPRFCAYTSELFYDRKLRSKDGLEQQTIKGTGLISGPGLYFLPVAHSGNQNCATTRRSVSAWSEPESVPAASLRVQLRHIAGAVHPCTGFRSESA
jgi:hypothetical protein